MNMWRRPIRTSYGLWTAITLALFVAGGFVNWLPESKSGAYWSTWGSFVSGDYGASTSNLAFALTLEGVLLVVPSIVLGWIGQAALKAIWTWRDMNGAAGN
jgi:hypothetical protein